MGYKNCIPENDILILADEVYAEVARICRPQYIYEIYEGKTVDNVSININGKIFRTGKTITHYLAGMDRCCVFAATAGKEYEIYKKQLREKGKVLEEFIVDAIGSGVAEACVNHITQKLPETIHERFTFPYSPGYCGWKLTEQPLLFSLLPDKPCGITLTESCLMLPIKSISGIIGIGKNMKQSAYACDICKIADCYKRKEYSI